MYKQEFESSKHTLLLREQIDAYVQKVIHKSIPRVPFSGYLEFIDSGSRAASEKGYFERRKSLAAMGLFLQYQTPSHSDYKRVIQYFEELLWEIANEATWCVAAHLSKEKNSFFNEAAEQIDLFAAETGAALAEIVSIHRNKLHPLLIDYIRHEIKRRILKPYMEKTWWWESVQSNWCAVCCGCIGMSTLLIEEEESKGVLLYKVDQGLVHYLEGFKEDGACEEGIGYWVYGFGYYIYYTALRKELDKDYSISASLKEKIKKIGEFPSLVQMDMNAFVPFSDVPARTIIPTGLLSYLKNEFGVDTPAVTEITPFDFDHAYRFAHISRNLWWTQDKIFHQNIKDETVYLSNRQWLLQRNGGCFAGIKGGNNDEQHNHNDAGNFVLAIGGEQFIADLGAGIYTADYFGEKRYEFVHTRSKYHNLPLINNKEQIATGAECQVEEVSVDSECADITMELKRMYPLPELNSYKRTIHLNMTKGTLELKDIFEAEEDIIIEESFISYIKPVMPGNGELIFYGEKGMLILSFEADLFAYTLEEILLENHYGEKLWAYRVSLLMKEKKQRASLEFKFILDKIYEK